MFAVLNRAMIEAIKQERCFYVYEVSGVWRWSYYQPTDLKTYYFSCCPDGISCTGGPDWLAEPYVPDGANPVTDAKPQ